MLKNLMIDSSITQQQLADSIGYAQRTVSSWIRSQSEPTETAIKKCAEFFDVSTDYLLGLDDIGARTAAPSSTATGEPLTDEEHKILEQYRSLPEKLKELIKEQLKVYTETEKITFSRKVKK